MRERIAAARGVLGIALGGFAVAGCAPSHAEQPTPREHKQNQRTQTTERKVDPKADELLRRMSENLATAPALQFDADHTMEMVTDDGEVVQYVAGSRVAIQRPNKARSDRTGKFADATLYYDGKKLTIYGKRMNMFASKDAPPTLDAALDFARDTLDLEAPAADLVYSDVYTGLIEDVVSGRDLGKEPIGDRMCHHLAFRGNETDWQIWIEDTPRALPCRYVITSKKEKGSPSFAVAFSNWRVGQKLPASHFTFTPPPGATQIDFLPRGGDAQRTTTGANTP
jgi:hypothetical protein